MSPASQRSAEMRAGYDARQKVRMRRNRSLGLALVGLLVVSAISVAAGSGRKPAMENSCVSIRLLTDAEAEPLNQRYPELRLQHEGIARFGSAVLERAFRTTSFYRAYRYGVPSIPYMMAIGKDSLLSMPDGFNWLLLEQGTQVSDKNIVELARAFVLLAVGDQHFRPLDAFPSVIFLEAKRITQEIGGISCEAKLKVRVGEQLEEWYFDCERGQFWFVTRQGVKGLIKFYVLGQVEPHPGRGQPDKAPQETKTKS
jgi:hypothetical protein